VERGWRRREEGKERDKEKVALCFQKQSMLAYVGSAADHAHMSAYVFFGQKKLYSDSFISPY